MSTIFGAVFNWRRNVVSDGAFLTDEGSVAGRVVIPSLFYSRMSNDDRNITVIYIVDKAFVYYIWYSLQLATERRQRRCIPDRRGKCSGAGSNPITFL